jgi:spermidine synthase
VGFVASAVLFADLAEVTSGLVAGTSFDSFGEAILLMFARSSLILFVPAVFLGATLPLATDICTRGMRTLGHGIGRVYAINTMGSILGSLSVAFLLIPFLGMARTLKLLVGLNLMMALALAFAAVPSPLRRAAVAVATVVLVLAVQQTVPADLFVRTLVPPEADLVFYREGATDTVGVLQFKSGSLTGQRAIVYGDQRGTATTTSYPYNFFFAHLPMLLHSGEPRRVLHICFGVGNSLSAITRHDSVERVDNVDLSPHVIEAAPYFWTNDDVIEDPRVRTIISDGRTYVMTTDEMYDVIRLEPPEVFTSGVINLYTREFYEEAAKRLAPGGILEQWVPVGYSPLRGDRMLFRAFYDVFPNATAWQQLRDGFILLIGSNDPLTIDYERLRRRMQAPKIRRDLELSTIRNVDHLLSLFVYDPKGLEEFTVGWPAITDDRTILDFTMPHHQASGFGFGYFGWSQKTPSSSQTLIDIVDRGKYFTTTKQSVMPLLVNTGDSTDVIAARIAQEGAIGRSMPVLLPRAAWQR